jgi:hypothetical protein
MLRTTGGFGAEEEADTPCPIAAANLADLAGDGTPTMWVDLEWWMSSKREK